MKIPKNFLNTTSIARYREYLKLLPSMKQENTRIITTLILTFFAMSFFGIFAINPTISTIVKLKKQLADSHLVYANLKTKIQNLDSLQQQYKIIESDLPLLQEAIPNNPKAPILAGEILGLAKEKKISIKSLDLSEAPLTPNKSKAILSFGFSLEAEGSYQELIDFSKDLTNISRVLTVESITLSKSSDSNQLILNLRGKAYFKY
ncbi:MAG TPA: type 4a pilus biogenesis protein PilO [Candidatus Limnocylindrales bacterium]|nr:type 4a pilus biogenesis protein PilO [Candidatus Limnocylindrales bacterium]